MTSSHLMSNSFESFVSFSVVIGKLMGNFNFVSFSVVIGKFMGNFNFVILCVSIGELMGLCF